VLNSFELGADDVVSVPCEPDVLVARIRASLSRQGARRAKPDPGPGVDRIPDFLLEHDARVIQGPRGEVHVNPKEHDLLELLSSRPSQLFTRKEITESIWHYRNSKSRTVDVYVARVRAKLEQVGSLAIVQVVPRIGYRLVLPRADVRDPEQPPNRLVESGVGEGERGSPLENQP
jgi:DNA-binding response OmpR family regulator